jgi:uncharacterized protein YukE
MVLSAIWANHSSLTNDTTKEQKMSGIVGAELGQLDDLQKILAGTNEDFEQIISKIGSQIAATWWNGPAADRFKDAWIQEYESSLLKIQAAIVEASNEVRLRYDAIDAATR